MDKEKCFICGREYKRLDSHITGKHKMSMEDYRLGVEAGVITEEGIKPLDEAEPEQEKKEEYTQVEKILSVDKEDKIDGDRSFKDVLAEYQLTEKEFVTIVTNYKDGKPMSVRQVIERNKQIGVDGAESLKDDDMVETTKLPIAEELTKSHGFEVVEVKKDPIKTWVLKKL